MKFPLLSVLLLFFVCCPVRAHKYDDALSRMLSLDFETAIKKFPSGREVFARLEQAGPRAGALRILIRPGSRGSVASFYDSENAVRFNSGPMSGFFGMEGADSPALIELLYRDPKARAALVDRADATYLHELTHALQGYLYPNYRRDVPRGIPLEFEYEAYLTGNMYTHEKMRGSPELLKRYLDGSGYDVYTFAALSGYLSLSLDLELYKENIRKKYEEELGGFISLEEAEKIQRNSVEESKIIAYASGRVGEYADKKAGLAQVSMEKEAYAKFLKNFYGKRWPAFSAEALLFIGSAAMEVKNYPIALECLAGADVNAVKSGVPPEELKKLKGKGALAILEAAAFIKDKSRSIALPDLGRHLKALETACANTGRPFPAGLTALRREIYPRARKYYSGRAAAEKNSGKAAYYRENADYFSRVPGGIPIKAQ